MLKFVINTPPEASAFSFSVPGPSPAVQYALQDTTTRLPIPAQEERLGRDLGDDCVLAADYDGFPNRF